MRRFPHTHIALRAVFTYTGCMKKKKFTPTPFVALCQRRFSDMRYIVKIAWQLCGQYSGTRLNTVKTMPRKVSGFTILELLVSIAVVVMLMSAVMIVMSGVKQKSRDAERMSELRQVGNALNLYYTNIGRFPIAVSATPLSGSDAVSQALINEGAIPAGPVDPLYPTYAYSYQSSTDGSSFTISFCLETNTIAGYNQGCGNIITP